MIVQPHELLILVVVVLLLRGSELTTQSFITRMNEKHFGFPIQCSGLPGGRWHENEWKEEGGGEAEEWLQPPLVAPRSAISDVFSSLIFFLPLTLQSPQTRSSSCTGGLSS